MRFGVSYYPEQFPPEQWPDDARAMRAAGLSIVRLAEFAWQRLEPAEGAFDWPWLDQAIDVLAAEGLQVVLGTPTAAPPPWLCHAAPSILPVDAQGRRRRYGARRHYCPNAPAYHAHTDRIVSALAARYGRHPAVSGWQIDNEFGWHGTARCYCGHCAAAFRAWLRARYATLEALNAAWGGVFWSQAYTDWAQLQPPNLTVAPPNPGHALDYYRFASDAFVAYQQRQVDGLRARVHARQFITTNVVPALTDLDYFALARPLDFAASDSYPSAQAERDAPQLYTPGAARPPVAQDAGDPYVTGFYHDLVRGLKRRRFWVMEQQCGHILSTAYNVAPRPGTVRLWTWHAAAAGAEAVLYFHWRALRVGQEQYHSALLRHDGTPDVGHADVQALRAEHNLLSQVAAAPAPAGAALLMDYADLWALALQPQHRDFGYLRHLYVYYRALQSLAVPTDIVPHDADLSAYPLIIAPSAHVGGEALAQALQARAEAGATVLLGARTGFKDRANRVVDAPGPFTAAAGASVRAWHSLPPGLGYAFTSTVAGMEGPATLWAEALAPAGARSLAEYTGGPLAGSAALTENPVGAGRVLYVGFFPVVGQAAALLRGLAGQAGLSPAAEDVPDGLLAVRRGAQWVLLNFTDDHLTARLNGQSIIAEPRNVRVVPA